MSIIDGLIIVTAIAFGITGYRRGLIAGTLSLIGFAGGVLVGVQLAPAVGRGVHSADARLIVGIIVVLATAILGQGFATICAALIRDRIRWKIAHIIESFGGAIVSVVAAVFALWLFMTPLAFASSPWMASQIRHSPTLRAIDSLVPEDMRILSRHFSDLVGKQTFPEVFGRLAPTEVTNVSPPNADLINSTAARTARNSVVKVLGVASSCQRRLEGSGFVYSPRRIVTNAHVVAGVDSLKVEFQGNSYAARVVVYDPDRDLAILRVPNLPAQPLSFASPGKSGEDALVIGFPLDGPYTVAPARIRDIQKLRGNDIYGSHHVDREVYSIRGKVLSGNSGGPLMTSDGKVFGVVFANAVDDPETGFALSAAEAKPVLDEGRLAIDSVSTGTCD